MDLTCNGKIILLLLVTLQTNLSLSEVYKFDFTTFDGSPLVGSSSEEQYRTYVSWAYSEALVNEIGRYEDTGPGDVGTGHRNPGDGGSIVPDGCGFPHGTTTDFHKPHSKHKRLEITMPASSSNDRIGVFYATLSVNGEILTIPTIKMSEAAEITPLKYTTTASIGNTIDVSVSTSKTSLRWVHNDGAEITAWNDKTTITIDNVRLADAGIYECYEDGNREMGRHAIMRLIVRECPGPKYDRSCSSNCDTCWNGGVCAADDGTCICQPGFSGTQCGQRCTNNGKSNNWGASCSLFCSSGNSDTACGSKLFCGPDPIGCACVKGYSGLDCSTPCPVGMYGANCDRECHCSNDDCDSALGCSASVDCDSGYAENYCQGRVACPQGRFGAQCEFHCNCDQGGSCNKQSGVCDNGVCAEGWAGNDCQQALPALYYSPSIASVEGITVQVNWDDWDQTVDYGNGPVDGYRLYYGIQGNSLSAYEDFSQSFGIIENLEIETMYEFAVAVLRSMDNVTLSGKIGSVISQETQCLAPTEHPTFTATNVIGTDSIELFWEIPSGTDWHQCSALKDFLITYRESDESNSKQVHVPLTNLTTIVRSLKPCTSYSFTIQATNRYKEGVVSPPVSATTIVAPDRVEHLTVSPLRSALSAAIFIEWNRPNITRCDITTYSVNTTLVSLDQCLDLKQTNTTKTTETSLTITGLEYFSTYEVLVWAISDDKAGPVEVATVVTEETVPIGSPTNVLVNSDVKETLTYYWNLPECMLRGGNLAFDYIFGQNVTDKQFINGSTELTSISFNKLFHYTFYEFLIRATTSQGKGPFTQRFRSRTSEGAPEEPNNLHILRELPNTIEIEWDIPENINGILIRYILEVFDTNLKTADDIYITRDLDRQTVTTNVTDLFPKTQYRFKVKAVTNGGEGPWSLHVNATTTKGAAKPQDFTATIIVAVSIIFVMVLLVLIVGIMLRRRRQIKDGDKSSLRETHTLKSSHVNIAFDGAMVPGSSDTDVNDVTTDSRPQAIVKPTQPAKPIVKHDPVETIDLFDYIRRKKTNSPDNEFSSDYKSLPGDQQGTCKVSKSSANLSKNRYKNIVTYDHSRVVLELIDGNTNSDYINASYIEGYGKERAYIAMQAPKPKTVNDMWRMVWQEQCYTIVMATKLSEGGKAKADQYWPCVGQGQSYGDIYVLNKEEECRDNFIVRHLHVSKNTTYANVTETTSDSVRVIKQIHFTTWPDMGVPDNVGPVLSLIEEMNESDKQDHGPIIVHCSAGVGRTGSIITIDTMLKMARSEGKVDIYNFVCKMRNNRVLMVQREEQYVFIHDAILEALFCRDTSLTVQQFESVWNEMSHNAKIQVEFKTLHSTNPPLGPSLCAGGNKMENVSKNRFNELIPSDSSRPYLMTAKKDGTCNNYINAAFCNGFQRDRLYIATQVPLQETVDDMWRMIYDYNCHIIVDLANRPFQTDQNCGVYIQTQDENKLTLDSIEIEYVSEKLNGRIMETILHMRFNNKPDVREVRHYQFSEFDASNDLPQSPECFLHLISMVENGMMQTRTDIIKEQRIAVVCLDGVTRCGLFCGVKSIIDGIKKDGRFDVYNIVKSLKAARPEMVDSKEQYVFCYEAAWAHIKSYATYANFGAEDP